MRIILKRIYNLKTPHFLLMLYNIIEINNILKLLADLLFKRVTSGCQAGWRNGHRANKARQTQRYDIQCFEITAIFKLSYGQLLLLIVRIIRKKTGSIQGSLLVGQICQQVTGKVSSGCEDL